MVSREDTRRKAHRLALAAAVLYGALSGAATPGLAQTKTTITLGVAVEPPHLDPSSHVAGSIREIVYANVYEGLMLTDENGKEYTRPSPRRSRARPTARNTRSGCARASSSTTARRSTPRSSGSAWTGPARPSR